MSKKARHQLHQFTRNKTSINFTNYYSNFICAIKFYKLLYFVIIREIRVKKKTKHQLHQFIRNKISINYTNFYDKEICAIKFQKSLHFVIIREIRVGKL